MQGLQYYTKAVLQTQATLANARAAVMHSQMSLFLLTLRLINNADSAHDQVKL